MTRLARMIIPGVPHHVTQRGNRRERIFFEADDEAVYLDLLSSQLRRCAVECWAYCLMPNHVHLILTPSDESGLARAVGEAHRRYTAFIGARGYTLIYTMSQLDSIDGINGVTGASEYVSGPGINGNYALANTLNAAGTTYAKDLVNDFEGTFEGLNNSIDNLTIKDNGATSDAVGLFGALHGTARDINLVNVSITETDPNGYHPAVGGLAGYSDGSLYNVSVSGDVNAANERYADVGGVIGYAANGTIYDARASDTVEGSSGDTGNVGGLVGLSYAAMINQSSATGNVTGTGTEAAMGGLVGYAEDGTSISESYATGNISGGAFSAEGGLVGVNGGTINQTYATGRVTSSLGGALGGLVGASAGGVANSHWDIDTSGQSSSAGGSSLTTAQLQSGTLPAGFSSAIWSVTPGQYPKLKVAGQ